MASKFIDISVLGSKKLNRRFNKLEDRVKGKIMREAAKKAMMPVMTLAKQRAPVLTGLLRKHIKIATYSRKFNVGAQVRTGTRKQMKIRADAEFYYPAVIERGTSKLKAVPFLRSSLGAKRQAALAILSKEIKDMMRSP